MQCWLCVSVRSRRIASRASPFSVVVVVVAVVVVVVVSTAAVNPGWLAGVFASSAIIFRHLLIARQAETSAAQPFLAKMLSVSICLTSRWGGGLG